MKINVRYTVMVTKNIEMEVSDDFKELRKDDFIKTHGYALSYELEDVVYDKLPEAYEILEMRDIDTDKILYETY